MIVLADDSFFVPNAFSHHTSDPTPREVTTTIVSKAGKNDVCEMQLHKQTCPPSWELGGYATLQILNE